MEEISMLQFRYGVPVLRLRDTGSRHNSVLLEIHFIEPPFSQRIGGLTDKLHARIAFAAMPFEYDDAEPRRRAKQVRFRTRQACSAREFHFHRRTCRGCRSR